MSSKEDDWQLSVQLRQRAFLCSSCGDVGQAVLDIIETAGIALRIDEERPLAELLALVAVACDALGMAEPTVTARRSLVGWMKSYGNVSHPYFDAALRPTTLGPAEPGDDSVGDLGLRTALLRAVDMLAGRS